MKITRKIYDNLQKGLKELQNQIGYPNDFNKDYVEKMTIVSLYFEKNYDDLEYFEITPSLLNFLKRIMSFEYRQDILKLIRQIEPKIKFKKERERNKNGN